MIENKAPKSNSGLITKQRIKKIMLLLFFLSLIPGLPLLGIISFLLYPDVASGEFVWNRIYVDAVEQTKTFSVGQHEVKLLVGTYRDMREEERREVDLEVSSGARKMPALKYRYSTDLVFMSSTHPGAYRLKDVDGDRQKDLVIRMGSGESNHRFYYISSQDGKGYQTDRDFQSSQPWVAGKPHW